MSPIPFKFEDNDFFPFLTLPSLLYYIFGDNMSDTLSFQPQTLMAATKL